ncbi:MAG: CHAT domain-containing protein [Syntrophobacteraceae bacterium]
MERLKYLDFELKFERQGDSFVARLLRSPCGEASNTFTLPFSEEKLELLVLKLGRLRGTTRGFQSPEMEAACELGGKLFGAVFSGELLACFRSSLAESTRQPKTGLRLKLRLQDAPELANLPWEFLFDPSLERFLTQSEYTPIVRHIELPERIQPLVIAPPLRLLVMISSPAGYRRLDVQQETENMQKALGPLISRGRVQMTWMEEATLIALQHRLREKEYHIFHFIGHGGFDRKSDEGVLVLERKDGSGWSADGHRVGTLLHDCPSLRLVVLNSCEGARNARRDPFASVAAKLLRQSIPAVVAMQFEITDEAAIIFSTEFYAALAEGFPVDTALSQARKAIYGQPNDVEWGTPVLYMRSADGVLFDVPVIEEAEAVKWYIDQGLMHLSGKGAPEAENDAEALKWFRKAADQGNAEGQYWLGCMYFEGRGVPHDAAEAAKWFRKAAVQGQPDAEYILGTMFLLGNGVPEDDAEALKWLTKAAEQGEANAIRLLDLYLNERSYVEALSEMSKRAWRKMADQGNAEGQCGLGKMYAFKDDTEALKWFRKAADQGNAEGQYWLGRMYFEGRGVPKDDAEAAKWFRKAAVQTDRGSASGQYWLGRMYSEGRGVPKDDAEAAKWFRKATDNRNDDHDLWWRQHRLALMKATCAMKSLADLTLNGVSGLTLLD